MTLLTPEGTEHGLLRRVRNSVQEDKAKRDPKQKAEYQKRREHDSKKVTARYLNHPNPDNGTLTVPYVKYAGDPIEIYKFLTGYNYEVPRGLVDQVNESSMKMQPIEEEDDGRGNVIAKKRPNKRVHEFIPVGF